jgi:hypothetical protein
MAFVGLKAFSGEDQAGFNRMIFIGISFVLFAPQKNPRNFSKVIVD